MLNNSKEILRIIDTYGYKEAVKFFPEDIIITTVVAEMKKQHYSEIAKMIQKIEISSGAVDYQDIDSAIYEGVWQALLRYDPNQYIHAKKAKFTSYAYFWVTKAIKELDSLLDYAFENEKGERFRSLEEYKRYNNGRKCLKTTKLKASLNNSNNEEPAVYYNEDSYILSRRKRRK